LIACWIPARRSIDDSSQNARPLESVLLIVKSTLDEGGDRMTSIRLVVNGKAREINIAPDTPLLWVLRDTLGLTGTRFGCGLGLCGACTVHLDGEAVRSCQTPVASVGGKKITTIEGLSPDRSHPVQRVWIAEQVPQCGYCQSGQIMQAAAFLTKNPRPTRDEIDRAMSGNICRCATYQRIRRAIQRAAAEGA
jgi:isoquinoline 1-oxidoreductase alpha subunit